MTDWTNAWACTFPWRVVSLKNHKVRSKDGKKMFPSDAARGRKKDMAQVAAMKWQGSDTWEGPLVAQVHCRFRIPASGPNSAKDKGEARTSAPDLDNGLALVFDALQGICYEDDAQIVSAEVVKVWWPEDEILVMLAPLDPTTRFLG